MARLVDFNPKWAHVGRTLYPSLLKKKLVLKLTYLIDEIVEDI